MFEKQAYCILFLGVLYDTEDNDPVKITQRIKESYHAWSTYPFSPQKEGFIRPNIKRNQWFFPAIFPLSFGLTLHPLDGTAETAPHVW